MPEPTPHFAALSFGALPPGRDRRRFPARHIVLAALGGLGLVAAIFAVLFAIIVHLLRDSAAYRTSLDYVMHQPAVVRALGLPLRDDALPTGRVEVSSRSGSARFSIHLHGSRGDGWAHVVSHRTGGVWIIDDAEFELHGTVIRLTPGEQQP